MLYLHTVDAQTSLGSVRLSCTPPRTAGASWGTIVHITISAKWKLHQTVVKSAQDSPLASCVHCLLLIFMSIHSHQIPEGS